MKSKVLIKENKKIELFEVTPELLKLINSKDNVHLCNENCKNLGVSTCSKVADVNKKTIDEYDYIISGTQHFNDNGEMESFVVNECTLYEKAIDKKLSKKEKLRQQRLTESLKNYHFETDDIDKAHLIQYRQMMNGDIINADNKVLPDNVIVGIMLDQPDKEILLEEYVEFRRKKHFEEYNKTTQNAIIKAERELTKIRNARQLREEQKQILLQFSQKKNV